MSDVDDYDFTDDMDPDELAAHNEAMENDREYRKAVYYERN